MKLTEHTQRVLNRFSEMMIERMKEIKASDWKKGWLELEHGGCPVNLQGSNYHGANVMMLMLDSCMHGYEWPIYCTLKQANELGARINKGAVSMPIIFWDMIVRDEHGTRLQFDEFKKLDRPEREKCTAVSFLKSYNVFNIQQTNIAEVKPDKYKKLTELFFPEELKDDKGMYSNKYIDRLLDKQDWLCPIDYTKPSNEAFFSPARDRIVVPMKSQFKKHRRKADVYEDGQRFYATLLHEMIHSTGTEQRLNRDSKGAFGSKKYAKEELVAELGAARLGMQLGFTTKLLDNHAAYLDSWLTALNEEPQFILKVMTDVERAACVVIARLGCKI